VTIPDAPTERLALVASACDAVGIPHRVVREHPAAPIPTPAIAE